MRSLERRFKIEKKSNPTYSSFICFVMAVKNQKFIKSIIARWFNKLVEKDDYFKRDKKALISHLTKLSNGSEEYIKSTVFVSLKPISI